MAGVSKADLEREIEKILKNANLAKTSTKKVIQKLEEVFDTDLSEKKKMIDQLVMDYVNNKASDDEEEASHQSDNSSEASSEEEEKKKPAKKAARPAPKKRKASTDEEYDDANGTNSESEEENAKPAKKGRKKKESAGSDSEWNKKAAKPKKAGGRGKASGYTKAYKLSPALAELMGKEEMPRHEVVRQVWSIIKEKNLYDPNNRQYAICDDALYKVIGTKRFRTFGMMKYLKTHFLDE